MNTNSVSELTAVQATAKTDPAEEICRNYREQPVLTCQYLLRLRETWPGTLGQFLDKAEELTCVKQAQVYRILRMQRYIEDFGELPAEQQPTWSFLVLLTRELRRKQHMDAWMTAVWVNGGTANGLSRKELRQAITAVKNARVNV